MAGIKFPFKYGISSFPEETKDLIEEIEDSIKVFMLTSSYELPMGDENGVSLLGMIFKKMTPIRRAVYEQRLKTAIEGFDTRVKVEDVEIVKDENVVNVVLTISILDTTKVLNFNYIRTDV